jgi:flagellar basal-body rod protein FlgB
MINPFFDGNRTNLALQAALDGYSARHRAIINNVANVDTPGYQRIDVSFEDSLKRAVSGLRDSTGDESGVDGQSGFERLARITPTVSIDTSPPLRADGSNVSIDREMAQLAKTSGRVNALTEILIRNYRDIKSAINGR